MESNANIKNLKEIITDVDEEGEARFTHEITFTVHNLTRFEYLQLHRQLKAGNVVAMAVGFLSPEMALEERERERNRTADDAHMDEQVREALNMNNEGEDAPGLAEAAGFKKGDAVTIIETGVHGVITKILPGGSGPVFWVPSEEHANREYAADEIEPYTAEKKRRSRRSKADKEADDAAEADRLNQTAQSELETEVPEVNLGAEIPAPSVQVDATVTTPDPEDYSTGEEPESGQGDDPPTE